MSTPAVLDYIGRQLGIAPSAIQASTPLTANVPRVVSDPGSGAAAYNLVGSTDSYKLEVQPDPSVPLLYVYTQAPTVGAAARLASASVQGLIEYLSAAAHLAPSAAAAGIEQLGPVQSAVANSGGRTEIGALVFFGVFGIAFWMMLIGARIRRGWSAARVAATRL
jgi:hypothetical protein